MMYPIHCPVVTTVPTLLHMRVAHGPMTVALNAFSNQTATGLAVPMISLDWDRITGIQLTSANMTDVPVWLRQVGDAADMVTKAFRETEAKVALEAKASSSASQHSLDLSQLNRVRMGEYSVKGLQRKSDPHGAPKSRWHLGLYPQEKAFENPGNLFLNEDGRSIHLRSMNGTSAVLGYGWHTGIMHYVDISATRKDVQSVALFMSLPIHPSDLTRPWFLDLVQSMMEFYAAYPANDAQIHITGTDLKKNAVKASGSWKDGGFLGRTYQSLSLAQDFSVETADLVSGYHNPSFQSISPKVPQGSIRYLAGEARVATGFYRSQKNAVLGETGLSPEQRHRLIFPKPSSRPPSRFPSRP